MARSHATGGTPNESHVPEPDHAERIRTLLVRTGEGSLGTRSTRRPGEPFVSLTPFAQDADGGILLLISDLAVHTRNLDTDPRASLLVQEPDRGERDPLGLPRVTLMGSVAVVQEARTKEARELYLDRHPNARYWVDFTDFTFRRLEVEEAYFVGGFGVMGWVEAADYLSAQPDPLVDAADGIIRHVNADHADALLLLARRAGIEAPREALMTGVDRLGFHLRIRTQDRVQGLRLGFPNEAPTPDRVREAMVAMVRRARVAEGEEG